MGLAAESPDQGPEEMLTSLGGGSERFETPPTWVGHYLALTQGRGTTQHPQGSSDPPSLLPFFAAECPAPGGSPHTARHVVRAQFTLKK